MTAHTATDRNARRIAARVVHDAVGEGILSIRLIGDDTPAAPGAMADSGTDAIGLLRDALANAAAREDLKVVLLAGLDSVFAGGGRGVQDAVIASGLVTAIAGFPLPLVALVPGDTAGAALLLASACDVMVCAEDARYGIAAGVDAAGVDATGSDAAGSDAIDGTTGDDIFATPAEHAFADVRFGPVLAAELLTGAHARTGAALHALGWCCPVLPRADIAAHAHALAARLADKTRDSLTLLKAHLARPLLDAALALAPAGTTAGTATGGAAVAVPKSPGKHVAVRALDGHVLLVTLRRGGKKHDTAAIAADLAATFARAELRAGHRAIVLASDYPGFLPEADAAIADAALDALVQALLAAPLPVVAIAGAAPGAMAWLALQCCDAVVHQADGRHDGAALSRSPGLAAHAAHLFGLRMGTDAARALLLAGGARTGTQLRDAAPALLAAPQAGALQAASDRAGAWSRWPHAAVLAWKAARAQALAAALAAPAAVPVDAGTQARADGDTHAPPPIDGAQPLVLASTVVSATAHPGGIVEVAMHDRASRNMLSPALVDGLAEAFARVAAMPGCKAVVLTGYDTYFCSGGTKDALRAIQEGKVVFTHDRTFRLPLDCAVPVIAAMQGHAIGAGLSMGLFCDFPMLSAESHYISPYMGYGFTPGVGATLVVPERWGQDLARDTLLTACECEGLDLQARGIALPVHERRALRDAAMALAGRLSRRPRADLVRMKAQLNRALHARLGAICEQEVAMHAATFVGRADTLARIEAVFGQGEAGDTRAVATDAAIPPPSPHASRLPERTMPQSDLPPIDAPGNDARHLDAPRIDATSTRAHSATVSTTVPKPPSPPVAATIALAPLEAAAPEAAPVSAASPVRVALSDPAAPATTPAEAPTRGIALARIADAPAITATPATAPAAPPVRTVALRDIAPAASAHTAATSDATPARLTPTRTAPAPAGRTDAPAARADIPLHAVRETLLRLLAKELHLDDEEIDADLQYTDLGLDSITGVTWMRKVNAHYGLSLDATIVYTYPTVTRLAQHVKALVGARDADQATPDLAELQTRKLRAFATDDTGQAGEGAGDAPGPASARRPAILLPATPDDAGAAGAPAHGAPAHPGREDIPLATIQATLTRLLARELHLDDDEVDAGTQYTDLGLDSITGVTWMRKVNAHYGLSLDATIVYTYPNLATLARHVKSLVDSRDADQATPDLAELQTRKLRAFGDGDASATTAAPAPATTAPATTATAAPAGHLPVPLAPATDLVPRQAAAALPATAFRQLSTWRRRGAARDAEDPVRGFAPPVPEDIAVIGMAGQFPMARDLETYWHNLQAGVDCISEVAPGRWDVSAVYQAGAPAEGRTNSRWLGQLEDYDRFDPLFFNISPAEARAMDPQQRVFLEACWHSIEHAGYDPKSLAGSRCGVFAGAGGNDYTLLSRRTTLSAYGFTGNACSILAARIAYFLDLQGPCVTLDTACSASLVAIASACDSLTLGSSDVALAGGVYVGAGPAMHIMTAQSGMLSADGKCHSFDADANGFVPGEAVGVVMLKRLADAERDGDAIHAVIRGWGVNQDGRTNGITAPNPASQARLMREVHRRHRIDPAQIQLVEAHGTGTPLGDPIEVRGLIDAFAAPAGTQAYCALGSVKSNIGHCLAAAGVSAVIKSVLALEHRQLPPTLHFERLNPHIRLDGTPFFVNTALQDWAPPEGARRHVAVSAFGYSGTNAHLVLGEYDGQRRAPIAPPVACIVPLSAKAPAQLADVARNLLAFVARHGNTTELADLAYTLQVGRSAMEERVGFVVDSMAQLAQRLAAWLDGERDLPDSGAGQVQKHRESLSLIEQDEEFRDALLERWMAQRKYTQLVKLWAKGMALDWTRLYDAQPPRRIALPVYPFARERYWIDTPDEAMPASVTPVAAAPVATAPAETAHPGAMTAAPAREDAPVRLCFEERWVPDADAARIARDAAQADARSAAPVILIATADTGWTLPGAFRIDDAQALEAAVERAHARDRRPVTVVCATAQGRQRAGIDQLFDLFKAVHACGPRVRAVLLVGLYDPTRADGIWDTAWIGFERSLRLSMPDLAVSLLFTDDRTSPGLHILDALHAGGIAAYRDGRRHVLALEQVPAPAPAPARLKQHGRYLITGGTGALGGRFARLLAQTCQAELVLLGRRPPSPAIAAQLDALRAAGARSAEYVALDLADTGAVAAWAATLPATLSGVLHAAGVSRSRPFHQADAADLDAVLAPKTTAVVALDRALAGQPLDFACYFSSSSAVLGDGGACDYAIANRFLMDYGRHRAHAGLPGRAVVINWPLWDQAGDAGDGAPRLGMGPDTPAQTAFYLKSSGQTALTAADGLALWQALLGAERVQTLVMSGQPGRILPSLARLYARPTAAAPASAAAPAAAATRPAIAPAPMASGESPGGDWRARLREDVRAVVAEALELPLARLHDETNLADYGFNSISLTTLSRQLAQRLAVEVTPALFFNRSNVAGLVEHFAAEHAAHFQQRDRAHADAHADTPAAPAAAVAPATTAPAIATVHAPAAPAPGGAAAAPSDRIAIVGMSGRFPKAADVDALWRLLEEERSGVGEIPAARWDWREHFIAPGHRDNRVNARAGGFLDGMDTFDPLFFEVSPAEAEEMDPAERLLLMESYRAIEDAGIAPASLRGRSVGVFVGMEESQYSLVTEAPGVTTLGAAMISSRLSYFLDLRGQALATNTACSSGLVALHQAVGSLRQGECEAALVASVSLSLSPKPWMKMSQAGMLSPDGLCRAFAKNADGIGIGEAVVAVLLMPLDAALAQGLPVYGVVRGSGTNFDGKTNGVTAPNGRAQEQLIETVYARHCIDAGDVSHVIAHGTGTRLGDPVELNALHNAFRTLGASRGGTHQDTIDNGATDNGVTDHGVTDNAATGRAPLPCAVTSVKSNLGHTMAASGLVSLVALLQGLRHRRIPATLHCEEDNDYISWRDSRLYINKRTRAWAVPEGRARIGAVSAFGRSGTNAHVVVEEFHDARHTGASAGPCVVPLSARTAEQLRRRVEDLLVSLRRSGDTGLAAVARTLQDGRDALPQRLAVVADSCEALCRELEDWLAGSPSARVATGHAGWRNDAPGDAAFDGAGHTAADALPAAARAWVQGGAVAWAALRGHDAAPARLHLPTYPFAQDRYWIEDATAPAPVARAQPVAAAAARRGPASIEAILDQVDAGTLGGGDAVAALKTLAGEAR